MTAPATKAGARLETRGLVSNGGIIGNVQALNVPTVDVAAVKDDDEDEEAEEAFAGQETDVNIGIAPSVPPAEAHVLEWNVAQYKVKLRKGGEKVILRDVVGRADAGSFNAILGPSGCGKTSLLDCLALRNSSFTGALRLDGKALTGTYFLHTGYVHQKELFFPHLTAREHLTFHAVTRLSREYSMDECLARVDTVMEEVDLSKVSDTRIGGGELYLTKGLSGGERKRLNIATELLADPSLLLLDEPTSGKEVD